MSTRKTAFARNDLPLPPYGYMNAKYMWDVRTRRVPLTFTIAGQAATPVQWRKFVENIVDELADFLWPRFDPRTQQWIGSARDTAMSLTVADLELMVEVLSPRLVEAVGGKGGAAAFNVTHKSLFEDEDEPNPTVLFPTLDPYLPRVPTETITPLKEAISKSLGAFGPAPLRFKELLQRPRAYQVAYMLNRPFSVELAKSSMTPSIPSAHSMQALVGCCAGYLATRLRLLDAADALSHLQQFSMDFGDRRVLAGVHYPSDNIASWYCALRLCDHLFGEVGQIAKDFMRGAIVKSLVYEAMTKAVEALPNSAYAIPLKRLADEMQRPADQSEP